MAKNKEIISYLEDLVANNIVTSSVSVTESQDEIDDHEGSSQIQLFLDAIQNRSNYGEESEYPSSDIGINQSTDFCSFMHEQSQQEKNFISQCSMKTSHHEPFIGQLLHDEEEVKRFYNLYAYKTGFSIRKATHYKAKKKDNIVTALHYVCSKEGQSKPKVRDQENKGTPKKQMQYTRTGCKAHMRVKRTNDGKWEVVAFVREHNHALVASPSKARFLRSHRLITAEQKKIIHMLSEQNISTSQIMSFMAEREGGA
ncbi:Protein FAR1-RELATED SEQUENCE 5 [Ananas comosus]|uniref:Protein FAR1-RELATED SEQUENCE 5 n=1 Tax=Ananas comosus TaxID=4615 RepID=A0A199W8T7_ANACO|nr:Protein FAR1-RELATED SEQUENCE 5 [Ananas comosus]